MEKKNINWGHKMQLKAPAETSDFEWQNLNDLILFDWLLSD